MLLHQIRARNFNTVVVYVSALNFLSSYTCYNCSNLAISCNIP